MLVKKLSLVVLLAASLVSLPAVMGEDGGNEDEAAENEDEAAENEDEAAEENDDAVQKYYYDNVDDDDWAYGPGDDYIQYWTDYAIFPKRCIVFDNIDVIVYTVHEHGYKQCGDRPMGTYITPVPTFMQGYLDYYTQIQEDMGYEDYELPEASQYMYCTRYEVNGEEYWLQMGCSDSTSQSIAVNIYSDNTCTTRSSVDGYDDANIDLSEVQLPFKNCQACVSWVDKNDDEIDDMFYENRQTDAPMCSTAWNYKQSCNRKCQKTGLEPREKVGWSAPDKILLAVLTLFGSGMLFAILSRRQNMSNKDALLEQAAISAAGLQQVHVVGIFVLIVIVITVFALLQLKNITWAMLLIMNTVLFAYLMKLTVDSGVSAGETIIGPDGTILKHPDSDDESTLESSVPPSVKDNAGTYVLPAIA